MIVARRLMGWLLASALTAPICLCQILVSAPAPSAAGQDECTMSDTPQSSASAARCAGLAHTSDLMDAGNHFFATVGALGGYDSAFDSKRDLSAPFEGGVVYAGLLVQKEKTFKVFENTASALGYHMNGGTIQYLDSTTATLTHQASPRTLVGFYASNLFGNDAIRVLATNGANVDTEAPSYGIYAGRVLDNQATLRVTHESTQTRWFSLSIRNNFRDFFDDNSQINTVHARAEVQYQPSPRSGIGLFEETSVESGTVDCSIQSAGVVYERRFSRIFAAEAEGAPAFGTKSCGETITANLYGSISAKPRPLTNFWVSGYRKLNDSWYADLTYENNVQAGWLQRFGMHDWFRLQGGWIGGTVPSQAAPFNGSYVASAFGHRLRGGLTASIAFQQYNWSGVTSIAPSRTLVTAGLYWSPTVEESDRVYGPMAQ
jgi:hypothetical protein